MRTPEIDFVDPELPQLESLSRQELVIQTSMDASSKGTGVMEPDGPRKAWW